MESFLAPILGEVDTRLLIVLAVGLVIFLILAILKKALKLAIGIGIAAIIIIYAVPMATEFQKDYKFEVADGVAVVTIKGKEFELDKDYITDISLVNEGLSGWRAEIASEDGVTHVVIPQFMYESVKGFANKYSIPIEVRE